jgi:hypothetical protein
LQKIQNTKCSPDRYGFAIEEETIQMFPQIDIALQLKKKKIICSRQKNTKYKMFSGRYCFAIAKIQKYKVQQKERGEK